MGAPHELRALAIAYVRYDGLSFGEAAERTGLTRNVVAGACYRAGVRPAQTHEKEERVRARHAAAMADPEVRARHAAAMKRAMADPEVRARHAAAMADPEVRARHAAAMKRAMADPEVRARHAAAMADPEVRARKSAAMKRAMARAVVKACGLPPLRALTDHARALLDGGHDMETAADALLQDVREARKSRREARA